MTPSDRQLALGARLRDIRQQQGLTLQQVEANSGGTWKAVVVGSYERGDRAISIAKLAKLAGFYRVPLGEFLPSPSSPRAGTSPGRGRRVLIDLTRFGSTPEHAGEEEIHPLSRYLRSIQLQRGDYNGRVLTMRQTDLQALSIVLGVAPDELVAILERRGLLVSR